MAFLQEDEREGGSLRLVGSDRWQKIQNLFAKVIGINIGLLDSEGNLLTSSHAVTPDITDIVVPLDGSVLKNPPDFVVKAVQSGHLTGKNQLSRYCLHYFLIEVSLEIKARGFFAIGPALVGKREADERITDMCVEEAIHEEIYRDQIGELKRYSYTAISAILEFLSEITEWSLEVIESRVGQMAPSMQWDSRGIGSLLSLRYGYELSNSLLDIALGLVEGESGSVLMYDRERDCFEIQAARGLKGEIIRDTLISSKDSISGLVASRGKPMLIHKEMADDDIRRRLNKPSISSSIVIPMSHHDQVVGLFCVNTQHENENFNQENLTLLNDLGRIAGIAFARIKED